MVQALYYSSSFRENVVNYPPHSPSATPNGHPHKVPVQIRAPVNKEPPATAQTKKGVTSSQAIKQRQALNSGQPVPGQPVRPEDKPDSPEYKKKQAMIKGPVLELAQENSNEYGMEECTFTGLKDIFMALMQSETRTGVLSPQRFLEIFRRDNEMFRNSMHQDAHEFYGLVLNDVIANVEANARKLREQEKAHELVRSVEKVLAAADKPANGAPSPNTGWVHDIFEGVLTSETKCLTCETASQRDETFLDLSIDLEEHSSVTSCLRKFSAEENLCERNKFHCDHCGGLQEAEKRMKIKRLPKVMALHLKRFKYSDDFTKLEKLFHRVVYPYHLRMFNTTDDADDPDRMYELYAVVVHIGGNAYHGHYVSIIKTAERGWLLFDDEMVEPVDKHFVRNFFGDKPGTACAYVLFYQETTFEKVLAQQEAEGVEEEQLARQKADLAQEPGAEKEKEKTPNGTSTAGAPLARTVTTPISPIGEEGEQFARLGHAQTFPASQSTTAVPSAPSGLIPAEAATQPPAATADKPNVKQSKEEKEREKKAAKEAEKARKAAEKEAAKQEEKNKKEREAARKQEEEQMKKVLAASKQSAVAEDEARKKENAAGAAASPSEPKSPGILGGLSHRGSKSLGRKSLGGLLGRDKEKEKDKDKDAGKKSGEWATEHNGNGSNGTPRENAHADKPSAGHTMKERFSFGIGRKKSTAALQNPH
jgi:ubiquitin carboxyl-terminal hydrolase 9/13